MAIRITCINKDAGNHENPHTAISYLGWLEDGTGKSGKMARLDLYNWIKDKGGVAYVQDGFGNKVSVKTAVTSNGTKYVRTYSDNTPTDNLLKLPECK
jgi:hypothetical protein